jgi:hypothetical protein
MRRLSLCLLGLPLLVSACASHVLRPGETFSSETSLRVQQERTFDTLVSLLHDMDMRFAALNQETGLVSVDPKTFTMAQMDEYCVYPSVTSKGVPTTTFVLAHAALIDNGQPGLAGSVALSFLVRGVGDGSAEVSLKAQWQVTAGGDTVSCHSRGKLEGELIAELKEALLKLPD